MKAKSLFLLLLLLPMVACQREELAINSNSGNEGSSKYNVIFQGDSPYLSWFFDNGESFVSYVLRDYPTNMDGSVHEKVKNTDDNTISLNSSTTIHLHDDYSLVSGEDITTLDLSRKAGINNLAQVQFDEKYSIPSVLPIQLIRPQVDDCNPIPSCYYDNFEIEWNNDVNNKNGVVIIAEWNGCTMHKPADTISVANVDIVNDSGVAILNTRLFEQMPNEALVNLWLIRGDVTTFGKTDGGLDEIRKQSPEQIKDAIEQDPRLLIELQPFMLGSAAVTTFSFFLIRK